jgi:polysaccharide export outer membrane protein
MNLNVTRGSVGSKLLRRAASLAIVALVTTGSSSVFSFGQQSQGSKGSSGSASGSGSGGGTSPVLVSPDQDYRIGPNDVIDVQIENAPELSRTFRVTAAGTFLMPYLGRITAVRKTPEELSQWIADRLRGDYLKDPKVTVGVKEYNSRSFFIQGAVKTPGVYQIEGRPSLLELITLAGGLADNHGSSAFIIRRTKSVEAASTTPSPPQPVPAAQSSQKPAADPDEIGEDGPRYELKRVNITGLLRGRFDQDLYIEPLDIVNIPVLDVFYVGGEVNKPGSYSLKDGTTLRQAISIAQGTTYKAAMGRGVIFREDPATGKQMEIPVDVGKVMSGKQQDLAIMANDIVIVPNSQAKSIGGALLRAFGMSAARIPY